MKYRDDKHTNRRMISFELRDEKIKGDGRYSVLRNYSNFVNNTMRVLLILIFSHKILEEIPRAKSHGDQRVI